MDCQGVQDGLPKVPDSARRVVESLCEKRRLTVKDLQRESGLARRTVYGALRRLQELGVVTSLPNLRDTRQSWFVLRDRT